MDSRRDPLRARSLGGFRTVWLNMYGWGALVGTGLVVGAGIALLSPLSLPAALSIGVLGTWVLLLVLDRRRYLNSAVLIGDGGLDAEIGVAVVTRLAELRISATYEESAEEDEGGTYIQRGILCRQADAERVRRVLSEHLNGQP